MRNKVLKALLKFVVVVCQLCETCLINSLSLLDLCAFAGARIDARARVQGARVFRYTLECSQSRLLNPHWVSKPEKPLISLPPSVSLPGREPPLFLSLSLPLLVSQCLSLPNSLSLSQLG